MTFLWHTFLVWSVGCIGLGIAFATIVLSGRCR